MLGKQALWFLLLLSITVGMPTAAVAMDSADANMSMVLSKSAMVIATIIALVATSRLLN